MAVNTARRLRCAIYTRKSTEEGLDQAFNSLDAQREACAAYILSQRHEGWHLVPDLYDDGGFTGGNMERPGLKQLLADVRAGRVDVVVVYKVDRLTRSLADFAKIVDVLDEAGASFVSVTQAFNTTNSMGRLTLNVLLSFAQFEREVIAERIRDKVAASKARGMWMGGSLPLGYTAINKKLVPVPEEAATVVKIMELYLKSANVLDLAETLRRQGIVSKQRIGRNGERSLDGMAIAELRKLLQQAELKVTVSREAVDVQFDLAALAAWVGVDLDEHRTISLSLATSQTTWSHEPRLKLDPPAGAPANDPNLVQLVARGFAARDQLLAMTQDEVRAMPGTQLRHLERIARLAYLAPDIVKAILDGRQPRQVTARYLSRLGALPLAWSEQRKMLGFPAS